MSQSIYIDRHGNSHQKPPDAPVFDRPSGYALIRESEGRILMVTPTWHDLWELPGGGIEPVEDVVAGIRREVLEETGYRVQLAPQPMYRAVSLFYDLADSRRFGRAPISIYAGVLDEALRTEHPVPRAAAGEIARIAWVPPAELAEARCQRIHWPVLASIR